MEQLSTDPLRNKRKLSSISLPPKEAERGLTWSPTKKYSAGFCAVDRTILQNPRLRCRPTDPPEPAVLSLVILNREMSDGFRSKTLQTSNFLLLRCTRVVLAY